MKSALNFVAVASAAVLAACGPGLPRPTNADVARATVARPATTLADLDRGRSIYLSRCGGCHRLYAPSDRAPEAWPSAVDEMAERARLDADQRELVTLFLVTMAARPTP